MAKTDHIEARINEEITADEVRLIDREGDQLGVMSLDDALDLAADRDLEVVEVEASAVPPVCRLMSSDEIDRRFQDSNEEESARPTVLREIRLDKASALDSSVLDEARAHLERGDKLKVTLRDVGRGSEAQEAAAQAFDAIAKALDDRAIVEVPPERAGRDMVAFYAPQ